LDQAAPTLGLLVQNVGANASSNAWQDLDIAGDATDVSVTCSISVLVAGEKKKRLCITGKCELPEAKACVNCKYGIKSARSELNVLVRKSSAAAREWIVFGTAERHADSASTGHDERIDRPRGPPKKPRVGDAEERLVPVMYILVAWLEGRAIESPEYDRGSEKPEWRLKLSRKVFGDPDCNDGAELTDVKPLVVELWWFGSLVTNGADVGAIFGMNDPEGRTRQVEGERNFSRSQRKIPGSRRG
jgi:hypothetical protein